MRHPQSIHGAFWRPGRLMAPAAAALAAAALAAAALAAPVSASGPIVTVGPAGRLAPGTHTITVAGEGFDPAADNGNGVYVVFGPITPAPGYFLDPSIYAAFKWVFPAGQDSGATAPMAVDGSFTTTLDIPSNYTGPAGPVDCATVACAVITFGAHGSQDRSQDTCTVVPFIVGSVPYTVPSPGASPTSATEEPAISPIPSAVVAAATGTPGDACSVITGVVAP